MKIEVKAQTKTVSEMEYPFLAQGELTKSIVLFTNESHGFVVNNSSEFPLGYFSESWEMHHFTPFTGSVTLSND